MAPRSPRASEEIARRLNRTVKGRRARLRAGADVPLGAHLMVRQYRLGNGLEVRLVVDRSAPVIGYQTWFRTGSRHERPGKTGLAHLFEHLMFNQTQSLAAGEFDRRMELAGAETNASTWTDWTQYYENLPAKQLAEVMSLEANRLQHLVLREPQVSSEKEVVSNERRWAIEDDVEGSMGEQLYDLAFREHPYRWPTIGYMRDIEGFTATDCRAFYRTYYAPNNAVLVVVGDFDEEECLALIQSHYGGISAARLPKERVVREPAQRRERRRTIRFDTEVERLAFGYRGPAFATFDWLVLTVLSEVLFGGRNARMMRELVVERELVSSLWGSPTPFEQPSLYEIWATLRSGASAREVEAFIDEELHRLRREPISQIELERVKNKLELGFFEELETAGGKAEQIGFYEVVAGGAKGIFERLEAYRRVSVDDVRRVARRYLKKGARSVIHVIPQARGAR